MDELLNFSARWLHPSVGLASVQWSLLLAVATVAGYLVQRYSGLPKMVGYSLAGAAAGLLGFGGAPWPLQGVGLFLVELGVALALFEAGGRIALRWFRHNPMVLVQSVAESALTWFAVYRVMLWLDAPARAAAALAVVAVAASPMALTRVAADARAAGPVTERAIALTTLSSLYALTLGSAEAGLAQRPASASWLGTVAPMLTVLEILGVSIAMGALLALLLRLALRVMSPTSENTAILLLTLVAACTAIATHLGGCAPLAALLGGVLLRHWHPRPWAWPRQLGAVSSLLTMLLFVLVCTVAAQAGWSGAALALVAARLLAKAVGVCLGNAGSGASWRQALWLSGALAPMSAVALLVASQFAAASAPEGALIERVALPAILLMELLGAALAALALRRAGEMGRHPGRRQS